MIALPKGVTHLETSETFGPGSNGRFAWDLETNGLLDEVSKVHCAVLYDLDTDQVMGFRPHEIGKFLELYMKAKQLVGWNSIGYDFEVIRKIYQIVQTSAEQVDGMVLARVVFSDVKSMDFPLAKAWKSFKTKRDEWDAKEAALATRSSERRPTTRS